MTRLGDFSPRNPFHQFVCNGCGKEMGQHWVYRPDSRLVLGTPKHDGVFYCHSDKSSRAGEFHQRGYVPPVSTSDADLRRLGYGARK